MRLLQWEQNAKSRGIQKMRGTPQVWPPWSLMFGFLSFSMDFPFAPKTKQSKMRELNCLQVNLCNEISCHLCPKEEKKQLFAGGPMRKTCTIAGSSPNLDMFVSMGTQPCSVLLLLTDRVLAQVHVLSSHAEHIHYYIPS
jgi:hypothetical protein